MPDSLLRRLAFCPKHGDDADGSDFFAPHELNLDISQGGRGHIPLTKSILQIYSKLTWGYIWLWNGGKNAPNTQTSTCPKKFKILLFSPKKKRGSGAVRNFLENSSVFCLKNSALVYFLKLYHILEFFFEISDSGSDIHL